MQPRPKNAVNFRSHIECCRKSEDIGKSNENNSKDWKDVYNDKFKDKDKNVGECRKMSENVGECRRMSGNVGVDNVIEYIILLEGGEGADTNLNENGV